MRTLSDTRRIVGARRESAGKDERKLRRKVRSSPATASALHSGPDRYTLTAMFTKELFAFLDELRDNNSREWFDANRDRYEQHVREPALDFITAFAPRLEQISPRFEADARRSGGSLFRINRDTRFAKDKSPYRTNAGIIFHHQLRRTATTPGFYLHLEPGRSFA